LESLIDPVIRGDQMSPLRWTSKSIRVLTRALKDMGHEVSTMVTRRLLRERGYSLQANAKTMEGAQHADRDAQFGYLNDRATDHLAAGDPVISVDTKRRKRVGAYKNNGGEWRPQGEPEQVKVYDFIDKQLGKSTRVLRADVKWLTPEAFRVMAHPRPARLHRRGSASGRLEGPHRRP
jgi:hypothetical protein